MSLDKLCREAISSHFVESSIQGIAINTEDDLRRFVHDAFNVAIPDVQVCPNHSTPWRAFADAFFAKNSVSVWKASRGFGGKSFLLALLGLTEAAALKVDVNILGGSGEQSERVHEYMQKFWGYPASPRQLLMTDPSMRKTKLVFGNTVAALLASTRSVRGPHPARLRIDEADEIDWKVFEASLGQTMTQRGIPPQMVISSTHQYADGTMTEVLKLAAEKGWNVAEWCWRESVANGAGWLSQAEVDSKRQETTDAMWRIEYELQEPSPESRAIIEEAVRHTFDKSLGSIDGIAGEHIFEPWNPEARYVHGADWAKEQDYTVILTLRIDVRPFRLVAYYRGQRMSWPHMISIFDKRRRDYNGGSACHDGTGIGNVVNDYIDDQSDVEGFVMSGKKRDDLLSEYIAGIENGEVTAPYIRLMENEHRLASLNDVYGSGHLPDTISAGALAYRAAKSGGAATAADHLELGQIEDYTNPWA